MNKCIIFLLGFFLTACYRSPILPDKERDLSEFIPSEEVVDIVQKVEAEKFNFVAENFPENCEWKDLVRIIDGDTIIVDEGKRVRFIGLDTPETKHPEKPVQKWGPEASEKTKSLLDGSEKVCLIFEKKGDRYDTYNRLLAYIFTEEGGDISELLLSSGLARGYYWFSFEREDEFRYYENKAKEAGVGVWE